MQNGIAPLEAKGAVGVQMLREDRETETEFVTISYWESVEAMTGGSAADPRQAHHLERDPEFLIELPRAVQILTILEPAGRRHSILGACGIKLLQRAAQSSVIH